MDNIAHTKKANQQRLLEIRQQDRFIRRRGMTAEERSLTGTVAITTAQMLASNRVYARSYLSANRILRAAERGEIAPTDC